MSITERSQCENAHSLSSIDTALAIWDSTSPWTCSGTDVECCKCDTTNSPIFIRPCEISVSSSREPGKSTLSSADRRLPVKYTATIYCSFRTNMVRYEVLTISVDYGGHLISSNIVNDTIRSKDYGLHGW